MNKEILEYYLEAHEEKFGTRPEIKKPIAEQIDILNKALKDGYPVEYGDDFDGDWQGARIDLLSREIKYLNKDILALRKIQNIHLAIITIALLLFLITIL